MPINRYEDSTVAHYWNKKYEGKYHPYLHGRRNKVLQAVLDLNLPKDSSCLELGTGGGQNAVRLADMGFAVHGIDNSDALLSGAMQLQSEHGNLSFSKVDLNSRLPFEDESFDVVVVIGTLQYLMEPVNCVKEVNRVLKPGGKFIICQRNALSFNVMRRPISFLCCALSFEGFEWAGRNVTTAIGTSMNGTQSVLIKRMVKFTNLSSWLEHSGFKIVSQKGYTPDFTIAPKFFRLLDKVLATIPYLYRFSHVILVVSEKRHDE